jgi:hypothetical protein
MDVKCTKSEGAVRQIDVAIGLLFSDEDPLAIRTLAAAGAGVFADLVETKEKGTSWRSALIQGSGLEAKQAFGILNAAQNFLKHANVDPSSVLTFQEEENDHLIFIASMDCIAASYPLSLAMQAYQIWYLAVYPEKLGQDVDQVKKAINLLPKLANKSRQEQLLLGRKFLESVLERKGFL